MKNAISLLFLAAVLLSAPLLARADLAKPKTSPQSTQVIAHNTGLTIEVDGKAYEARLQISEEQLKQFQASLATAQSSGQTIQSMTSSTRTIIAGFSFFAAIALGGVWMVRSRASRTQKGLVGLLIVGFVASAAAIVTQANTGPPPSIRWRSLTQNLTAGKPTSGTVKVELVPGNGPMKLILPLPQTKPGDE